jgi:hypothetical protein
MREITSHVVNPANDRLKITVEDEPGQGNACHLYMIRGFNTATNASDPFVERHGAPSEHATILFQNGPIDADGNGLNGLTHEALIAILIDRMEGFQSGPYACRENAIALTHLQDAAHWLAHRTRARMARGVEGTHKV